MLIRPRPLAKKIAAASMLPRELEDGQLLLTVGTNWLPGDHELRQSSSFRALLADEVGRKHSLPVEDLALGFVPGDDVRLETLRPTFAQRARFVLRTSGELSVPDQPTWRVGRGLRRPRATWGGLHNDLVVPDGYSSVSRSALTVQFRSEVGWCVQPESSHVTLRRGGRDIPVVPGWTPLADDDEIAIHRGGRPTPSFNIIFQLGR
jgi:hypothetical protein